eukprot:2592032-Lingulodinium_polyedra.AAC.1
MQYLRPTEAQQAAADSLLRRAAALGPPPAEMGPQEALEELLGSCHYEGVPQTVAPLDVDKLALPAAGFSPVPLHQLVGEDHARVLVQGLRE